MNSIFSRKLAIAALATSLAAVGATAWAHGAGEGHQHGQCDAKDGKPCAEHRGGGHMQGGRMHGQGARQGHGMQGKGDMAGNHARMAERQSRMHGGSGNEAEHKH